ncbi:MAG TPA: hypothetical protein VGB17_19530 [Pyrinomonadaceae bacterium]|jgi:hypothetical protein
MRKFLTAALIIAATLTLGLAQGTDTPQSFDQLVKLARAPQQIGGLGRAVVVVKDQNGNPISNAFIKLESTWGDDQFCESWGGTANHGAIALNPIHMGRLKLIVKAKGFQTQKLDINASSLSDPINVTLVRK